MQDKVNYSLVGAFVIVLGSALIAAILWLAAGAQSKTRFNTYQSISKESVSGLNVDAPVKLLGVTVGKVSQITIDPADSSQVLLRMSVEQGTPIKQDTEAVLKSQGLTGIAYVELTGGSAQSPALIPTSDLLIPVIRSKASLSTRLEAVLSTVLANVDAVSANVNEMFDTENKAAVRQILADSAIISQMLVAQKSALTTTMSNAAVASAQVAKASAQVDPTIKRVNATIDDWKTAAKTVTSTSQSANKTIESATLAVDQISVDTLPSLNVLMADLNQLVRSLQRLSEQTARNPSSIILGSPPQPVGPGEKVNP